jgi:RIO kinase 1
MDQTRKEERREKEIEKTENGVFDKHTLLTISKLMSDGVIDHLDFPISSGKESFVFKAVGGDGRDLAIKVYPISTSIFRGMMRYIEGDPRYDKVKRDTKSVVFTWARKEFANLEEIRRAGVRAPEPIGVRNNVLIMEYIGEGDRPAPMLRDVPLDRDTAAEYFNIIVGYMRAMFKAGIVHGDMSEYNVLVWRGAPVVIDVGQAVKLEHHMAKEFLKRDVRNIVKFFNRYGINADVTETEQRIVKEND